MAEAQEACPELVCLGSPHIELNKAGWWGIGIAATCADCLLDQAGRDRTQP